MAIRITKDKLESIDIEVFPQAQGRVSGYSSGVFSDQNNTIDKFSFAADGDATDVGDLLASKWQTIGQQT